MAVPCLLDLSLVDECRERARVALDAMRDLDATPARDDARKRLLAAYTAALAHGAGSSRGVHDARPEANAFACETGDEP
ncbi:transcriptional regulator, winged helix family [Burkholderia ambifaria MEX-5]|uniref:Transcriptional regulator, winged helix family n=1 Tax=Burkholderia ambifaria MEX-5 TaxID=396597 RepID=B1TGU1_9BURK|nr:transcriptional regulator, winged helix family [Burkholderia ambifaria MEX-5]